MADLAIQGETQLQDSWILSLENLEADLITTRMEDEDTTHGIDWENHSGHEIEATIEALKRERNALRTEIAELKKDLAMKDDNLRVVTRSRDELDNKVKQLTSVVQAHELNSESIIAARKPSFNQAPPPANPYSRDVPHIVDWSKPVEVIDNGSWTPATVVKVLNEHEAIVQWLAYDGMTEARVARPIVELEVRNVMEPLVDRVRWTDGRQEQVEVRLGPISDGRYASDIRVLPTGVARELYEQLRQLFDKATE